MTAIEQYFPVVLFIVLYKVVLTLILSLWMKSLSVTIQMKATLPYCGDVYYAVQCGSNFSVCG